MLYDEENELLSHQNAIAMMHTVDHRIFTERPKMRNQELYRRTCR